jgi:hypothetical protein
VKFKKLAEAVVNKSPRRMPTPAVRSGAPRSSVPVKTPPIRKKIGY